MIVYINVELIVLMPMKKIMMVALLFIMLLLVVRVLTLPGAGEGLEFYLKPDFSKLKEAGIGKVVFAALGGDGDMFRAGLKSVFDEVDKDLGYLALVGVNYEVRLFRVVTAGGAAGGGLLAVEG